MEFVIARLAGVFACAINAYTGFCVLLVKRSLSVLVPRGVHSRSTSQAQWTVEKKGAIEKQGAKMTVALLRTSFGGFPTVQFPPYLVRDKYLHSRLWLVNAIQSMSHFQLFGSVNQFSRIAKEFQQVHTY